MQEIRNRQALATAEGEAREKERDMQSIIHELVRLPSLSLSLWWVAGVSDDVRWCPRGLQRR